MLPDPNVEATISFRRAFETLGIGESLAYELEAAGKFPTPVLRIGARPLLRVPTWPLLELLGVDVRALLEARSDGASDQQVPDGCGTAESAARNGRSPGNSQARASSTTSHDRHSRSPGYTEGAAVEGR